MSARHGESLVLGGWFRGHGRPVPQATSAILFSEYALQSPNSVTGLAFTKDGRHLFSATKSEVIRWSLPDGKLPRRVSNPGDGSVFLALAGRRRLVVGRTRSYTIFDADTLRKIKSHRFETGRSLFGGAACANGRLLGWLYAKKAIVFYDFIARETLLVVSQPDGGRTAIRVNRACTLAAIADGKTLRLTRLSDGTVLRTWRSNYAGVSGQGTLDGGLFTPDGRFLLFADRGELNIAGLPRGPRRGYKAMSFSPKAVWCGPQKLFSHDQLREVRGLRSPSGPKLRRILKTRGASTFTCSGDGRYLATTDHQLVRVWRLFRPGLASLP